ncbi:hypothetical protein HPP92_010688 [Vanilla planifolia]|uniref:Uncharacterized protein n=1 Tax=Vanilla planifolia TaxID=51239 RepID=A0A835V134_VANPL|nr:hypothetical protein HPP92_010688 [Vanilla planifolia]
MASVDRCRSAAKISGADSPRRMKEEGKESAQGIEGVYKTTVDSQQQNTVTGNVGGRYPGWKLPQVRKSTQRVCWRRSQQLRNNFGRRRKKSKKGGGSATNPRTLKA